MNLKMRVAGVVALCSIWAIGGWWVYQSPPNTFDPFCTYDVIYRLDATIAVDGQLYKSAVTRQRSFSRKWIAQMNSGGCKQTRGTVLSFRLSDNRLILADARICRRAADDFSNLTKAVQQAFRIQVTAYCNGIVEDKAHNLPSRHRFIDGFVIDDADKPARWEPFRFGQPLKSGQSVVQLVSATAEAVKDHPTDDLDRIAPSVLKTRFDGAEWANSPEQIIPFSRKARTKDLLYVASPY